MSIRESYNTSKSSLNVNQGSSHFQKTVKSFALCEESIGEYLRNKIILECVKNVTLNNEKTLSKGVVEKLKSLLSAYEFNKVICLENESKGLHGYSSLLGITDLPSHQFSSDEIVDVKLSIERTLRKEIHNFLQRHKSLEGNLKDVKTSDYSIHKKLFEPDGLQIMHWSDKMNDLRNQYNADILKCRALLGDWQKMKYQDTSQIYLEKIDYLLLLVKVAEVQAKITKLVCTTKMFQETPITIDAFRMLRKAIDDKLFNIMSEIKHKQDLKEQYDNLKKTDYDVVLKQYLSICKSIEKKKNILEQL